MRINSIGEFMELFRYSDDDPEKAIVCSSVEEQLNTYLFLQGLGYHLYEWERDFVDASPDKRVEMRNSWQYPQISDGEADEMTGEIITYICTTCREPESYDIYYDDIVHLINGVLAPEESLQPPDLSGLLGFFS